ncbi:hypothetical protein C2L66_11215 [Paraburkholderia caribensis]|nr:hypothetical protein C2L66_11215 [Paraburkholderia caribensis]
MTDVERLILEVQHQRQTLLQMRALSTAGIADARHTDPLAIDAASPLRTLEARILQELLRIEQTNLKPAVTQYCRCS